jgi:hypothetical protein
MSQHHLNTTAPLLDDRDVVWHESPPPFPRLQPLPRLSDEEWLALNRVFGKVHFVYDGHGFPHLSVLTESGTMGDSIESLRALMEPSAGAEQA